MDLDEPLQRFLRLMYNYGQREQLTRGFTKDIYDVMYKFDNNLFIDFFKQKFAVTEADVVVSDVRYLNELEELQKMGFTIVRVTSSRTGRPRIKNYIRQADKDTVLLSLLYDRKFLNKFSVDYSVNYTYLSKRAEVMDPLLTSLGYKLDINTPEQL